MTTTALQAALERAGVTAVVGHVERTVRRQITEEEMYCTPCETRKARSQHRCTNCGEAIEPGEEYARWASYDDGKCFTNKMHPECLESLQDGSGEFEYTLYGGERPEVVTPNTEAMRHQNNRSATAVDAVGSQLERRVRPAGRRGKA